MYKFQCFVDVISPKERSLLSMSLELDFFPTKDLTFVFDGLELDVKYIIYDVKESKFRISFEKLQTSEDEFHGILDTLQANGWKIA